MLGFCPRVNNPPLNGASQTLNQPLVYQSLSGSCLSMNIWAILLMIVCSPWFHTSCSIRERSLESRNLFTVFSSSWISTSVYLLFQNQSERVVGSQRNQSEGVVRSRSKWEGGWSFVSCNAIVQKPPSNNPRYVSEVLNFRISGRCRTNEICRVTYGRKDRRISRPTLLGSSSARSKHPTRGDSNWRREHSLRQFRGVYSIPRRTLCSISTVLIYLFTSLLVTRYSIISKVIYTGM